MDWCTAGYISLVVNALQGLFLAAFIYLGSKSEKLEGE